VFKSAKHIVFFLSLIVVTTLIIFVVSSYFGNNRLNRSLARKKQMVSVLPEGWAFFTINSRSSRVYFFKVNSGKLEQINLRNQTLKNAFGFSRNNRIYNMQLDHLHSKLPHDSSTIQYQSRASDIYQLIARTNADTLKFNPLTLNEKSNPYLESGLYVLCVQEMLPWAMIRRNKVYPSDFTILPVSLKILSN